MVNLLEFAATVLVKLTIAREDVQRFEQIDGLVGLYFGYLHVLILSHKRATKDKLR
jgi:hypothetical protein